MPNFTRLAAMATRLIAKNSREVTIIKRSSTPENPQKPWRGTDSADTELGVVAAFTDYDAVDVEGTMVRRGDFLAWVAPVQGEAIDDWDFLKDGEKLLKIETVTSYAPSTTVVAYLLELKR